MVNNGAMYSEKLDEFSTTILLKPNLSMDYSYNALVKTGSSTTLNSMKVIFFNFNFTSI